AHLVLGQCWEADLASRPATLAPQTAGGRQVVPARGRPLGTGQHQQHAGSRLCRAGIDRADARMRVRRAQDAAVGHIGEVEIVDIAATAADEPRVLETRHRLTQRELAHSLLLSSIAIWRYSKASSERVKPFQLVMTGLEPAMTMILPG